MPENAMHFFIWQFGFVSSPGFAGKAGLLNSFLAFTPFDTAGESVEDLKHPLIGSYYTVGSESRGVLFRMQCLSDIVMTVSWTGTPNSPPGRLHAVDVSIEQPLPFVEGERVWIVFTHQGQ